MPFSQRIRLPFYLTRPNFPFSSSVFRLADGSLKKQSSQVRLVYEGETDYMPKAWHESLVIALNHDNVIIEGSRLNGSVALEGDGYDIDWQRFLDYPVAKSSFKIQVDKYDFSNNNCLSCEEATQLELTDDNLGTVAEGDSGTANVFANDTIFCSPVTASITSYNADVLASAPTIDNTGNISYTLKSPLPANTGVEIFTYRVTCPSGGYDEAIVSIDIDGSLPSCVPPANVRLTNGDLPTSTSADITWDINPNADDGYYWELYTIANPGLVVLSQTPPQNFPRAQMTGLQPCTDYKIFVRSICDVGVNSTFAEFTFSTECQEVTCGRYEVGYDNGTPIRGDFRDVSYLDCNSQIRTARVPNMQTRFICALQNAPGDPVSIGEATSVNYIELCG